MVKSLEKIPIVLRDILPIINNGSQLRFVLSSVVVVVCVEV
jgi:hypothetical protein